MSGEHKSTGRLVHTAGHLTESIWSQWFVEHRVGGGQQI